MKDKEVKRSASSIHISNNLSLIQRKAYTALLFNAYDDLDTKRTHKIDVKILCDLIGFNSKNTLSLKSSLKKLAETLVEWNLLDKKGNKRTGASTMLAHFEIINGVCEYSFSEWMKKKLYDPTIFSLIKLEIIKRFKTSYAIALYENCFRFKNIKNTGWIDLSIFKKLMGATSKTYNHFKLLNSKVIKPAIKEVNKLSDIIITEMETKKEGRKIIAVKFNIEPQNENNIFPDFSVDDEQVKNLLSKLQEFGLKKDQALKMVMSHDEKYIQENLAVVEKRITSKCDIKNVGAYTIKALEKDFRPSQNKIKIVSQDETNRLTKIKKTLDKFEKEFIKYEEKEVESFISKLSHSKFNILKEDFLKDLYSKNKKMVINQFNKYGLDKYTVKIHFYGFIKEKFFENKLTKEYFSRIKNIDLSGLQEEFILLKEKNPLIAI